MGFHLSSQWHGPLRARHAYNILNDPEGLLAKVIKGKYGDNLWDVKARRGDSTSWKIICDGASSLRLISRWVIGDGSNIDIWKNAWIRDLPLDRWPTFFNTNIVSFCRVNELMTANATWDVSRLKLLFGPDLAESILQVPINPLVVDSLELN